MFRITYFAEFLNTETKNNERKIRKKKLGFYEY